MIELRDVCKSYNTGGFVQKALDSVSISLRESEFAAILGPSGSGKTTLLNVVGGLDHFDSGDIVVDGISTKDYGDKEWDAYRNHRVGFVFQSYNLIPHQTVLSNVELALTLSGVGHAERHERARAALERVGLAEHIDKRPSQLSGGQMQRVAIARALVNDPDIVLADEPTGALDTETGIQVMDLLKEISADRLVVMVTHNPELAERYATRIIRLADGKITDDTNPYDPSGDQDEATPNTSEATSTSKTSMSLVTALQLSFSNLMTKKGRTFLTAFAGSIGIIGIAAILALSNGVNDYIAKVEEDALSSYPLSITRSNVNLTSVISQGQEEMSGDTDTKKSSDTVSGSDAIPQTPFMSNMLSTVTTNDLSSFRTYLESGTSGVDEHVSTIEYGYGITPQIYLSDTSEEVRRVNPSTYYSQDSSSLAAYTSVGYASSSGSFQQMLGNQELLESQYDVVDGRWPESFDECVLVLSSSGKITDYTLYGIGAFDPDVLDDSMEAFTTGVDYELPENDEEFTYDDALSLTYKVVPSAALYQKSESGNTWTDMSSDASYMKATVDEGITLKVVGVIRPNDTTNAASLSEGIAYTPELSEKLMEQAQDYEIVQQQLDNPDVDVFTGKTFEELRAGSTDLNLEDLFTIDTSKIESAFSFDASALGIDASSLNIDTSALDANSLASAVDTNSIMSGISVQIANDVAALPDYLAGQGIELNDEEKARVLEISAQMLSQLFEGYPNFALAYRLEHPEASDEQIMQAYLQTDSAQAIIDAGSATLREELRNSSAADSLELAIQNYLVTRFQIYLGQATAQIATQLGSALSSALSSTLSQYSASLTGSLATGMQNAVSVDADAFADAISVNMTTDDLTSLLTNYLNAESLTYDNNLAKLGYADEDDPTTIYLYPKSFEDKEDVEAAIERYNDKAREADEDDRVISYSDFMGTLMSSVTDIVDTISLVLIAFVSISLVVSSIMIGIITYISVLERKKEIGILRAMGASKLNVANIFNAEAVIEGFGSGLFAIVVVALISIPVNAYILETQQVANIMQLSPANAAILIALSVVLTLLASLIPSHAASRRDPVEALRSE